MKSFLKSSVLLILLGWSGYVHAAELVMKPTSRVSGSEVRLVDVLSGAVDVPSHILKINLCSAPPLGQQRFVSREIVENTLRPWIHEGRELSWQGSDICVVDRPARTVSHDETVRLIAGELKKLTNEIGTAKVLEIADPNPFQVPDGNLETDIDISQGALHSEWAIATIRYLIDEQTVSMRSVRFRWSWEREVYQAISAIRSKEPVKLSDVEIVTRNALEFRYEPFTEDLTKFDMVAARSIRPGMILAQTHLKPRTLVHRGTPVMVNFQHNKVQIALKATALESGGIGEVIALRNESSRKKIYARVTGEGTTEYVY